MGSVPPQKNLTEVRFFIWGAAGLDPAETGVEGIYSRYPLYQLKQINTHSRNKINALKKTRLCPFAPFHATFFQSSA